jgi:hypothetical protein
MKCDYQFNFASPSFFSHLVAAVAVVVAEVLRTATRENLDIPGFLPIW